MQYQSRRCRTREKLSQREKLLLAVIVVLGFWLSPTSAIDRHWVGGDGAWSVPSNWNPAGAPQNGDSLYIDSSSDSSMLNDLNGLVIDRLVFMSGEYDILTTDYSLTGNPLTFSGVATGAGDGDIVNDGGGERHVTIQCRLNFTNGIIRNGMCFDRNHLDPKNYLDLQGMISLNGGKLRLLCDEGSLGSDPRGGDLRISGEIAGTGTVQAESQPHSSLHFSGTSGNSFSGELIADSYQGGIVDFEKQAGFVVNNKLTIIDGTSVKLHGQNQIGTNATVIVADGSLLDFQDFDVAMGNLIMTNVHADALPSRVVTGFGRLTLNGDLSSWVFNDVVVPTITGTMLLPAGFHVFNIQTPANYAGFELPAQVGGPGGFAKIGNAALALRGTNFFSGPVFVTEGIIDVYSTNAFGTTDGGVTLSGGSITLRNLAVAPEPLIAQGQQQMAPGIFGSQVTSVGSSVWTGPIVLNTNLVWGGGDILLQGYISGPGGLAFLGGGTCEIGGPDDNTYTGETIVRSPLLQLNKPFSVNAYAGPLTVGQNFNAPAEVRWLNSYQNPITPLTLYASGLINVNNQTEDFGTVTFNGGTVETGSGNFMARSNITANAASSTAVVNGNLALGPSSFYFVVSNGVAQPGLRVNAIIAGINITKLGQGTLDLAGANTHTGYTFAQEGILQADHPMAFGTLAGNSIVADGATIRLGSVDGMAEAFQLNGAGFQGTNGAFDVVGLAAITGGVLLTSASTIKVETNAVLAIDSLVSGFGPLTKSGSGNLYLGGVLGGTGNNTYSNGTVVAAGNLLLSKNQNVVSVPGPLTVGPSTPTSPAVARFLHSGVMPAGAVVTVNQNSLLDLNGNSQTLSQLNLNDGGGVQMGSGVLSFTAGGQVNVSTLNPSGLTQPASISGKLALPANDYVTFSVIQYGPFPQSSSPELTVSAAIIGSGNLAKTGFGALLLTGNNTFDGTPSVYSGEIDVNAGTLIAGSALALGGTNGLTYVGGSANLALINGVTIINETLYLNSTATRALDNRGGVNTWIGPVNLLRDSTVGVAPGWALTINGVISGTGNLIKLDQGDLSLAGNANNTFSGDTFVNEGTLVMNKSAYLQAVPANLIVGQTNGLTTAVARHGNHDQIWSNTTVNHGGLLDLNGFDEYTGILTLNGGGDVQTGGGTIYPFISVNVNPGTFGDPSVISGHLALYPYNIPSGLIPFVINSGSPATNNPDCLVSATISQYPATGGIQKSGPGALRLTGTNTYSGSNVVSAGTFWVDGQQPQAPVQLASGTILKGSGAVGDVTLIGSSTAIEPGSSPGILTTSNFNATAAGTGILRVELNGLTAGTGYDQLNVRGTVNLNGISLSPTLGFASSVGDRFTILVNDGTDSVIGTFTGLAQGAKLYIGGELFQISYGGGSGNDVVLNRLVTPAPPKLKVDWLPPATVRLTWPTNDPPFHLQTTTNLNTGAWVSSSLPTSLTGTNLIAMEILGTTTTNASRFYRLVNP